MENDPLLRRANLILKQREKHAAEGGDDGGRKAAHIFVTVMVMFVAFLSITLLMYNFFFYRPVLCITFTVFWFFAGTLMRMTVGRSKPWVKSMGGLIWMSAIFGFAYGLMNHFQYNIYYENYITLRSYGNVQASESALQYIDAGVIKFNGQANIATAVSAGYKVFDNNGNLFCVAPIMEGADNPTANPVNFWAVGVNCCQERGGFECDDANDPGAHQGLVVLDEGQLAPEALRWLLGDYGQNEMYKKTIALQNAYYEYMPAKEVVLVHWTKDPMSIADNYRRAAMRYLIYGYLMFLPAAIGLSYILAKYDAAKLYEQTRKSAQEL